MASRINLNYFLKCKLSPRLLIVVLGLIRPFSVTECATHSIEIQEEVGGNATFYCANDTQKPINLMYFQKGNTFVNGFHSKLTIPNEIWQNTQLDRKANAVHMYNLNVSHEGDYNCHIEFTGNEPIMSVLISLRLTAPYSRPSISKDCNDESHSCLVQCHSHSGYPSAKMKWNIHGSGSNSTQMWRSVNSSEICSETTLLLNISSTAAFNCSSGELNVSCSVNGSTSDVLTICDARSVPPRSIAIVIAAVCGLGLVSVVTFLLALYKRTRQSKISAEVNPLKELSINNEEGRALNVTSPAS